MQCVCVVTHRAVGLGSLPAQLGSMHLLAKYAAALWAPYPTGPDCRQRLFPACHSAANGTGLPHYGLFYPKNCHCWAQ